MKLGAIYIDEALKQIHVEWPRQTIAICQGKDNHVPPIHLRDKDLNLLDRDDELNNHDHKT